MDDILQMIFANVHMYIWLKENVLCLDQISLKFILTI